MRISDGPIAAIGNWMAGGRKSPWGSSGDDSGPKGQAPAAEEPPASDAPDTPPAPGPRNPWHSGEASPPRRSASIEDIFRARKSGGGGGGGGFSGLPQRPGGGSWLPMIIGGGLLALVGFTSIHQIDPKEQGIVTTFGKYSRTLNPGVSITLPWPLQAVAVRDVTTVRRDSIPDGEGENLMLTGDQNLVDFSYLVRWNIKDLKLYSFQLSNPDETVREVAEAAMRASVAEVTLDQAMVSARGQIEQNVRSRMQGILDAYRSGITIQGVEIKKADPPSKVLDSFKEVTAAQQEAQQEINRARGWAQQVTARAEGEAAAFDKVYAQYRLAPEVTRRRMYYETMERVLSQTDKTIVEAPGVTTYLPLPELKRKAADSAATSEGR